MSSIYDKVFLKNNFEGKEEIEKNIGKSKEDFFPLKILCTDEYYQILKVKSEKNNKIYLMKILKKKQSSQVIEGKYSTVEILVLKKLKHKNIIKYLFDFEDSENYYIIMEYTNLRNLNDFYLSYKYLGKQIEEEIIWKILYQCLIVLVYIHNEGIIHREIHPKNILIDEDFNIKLINFNKCAAMDNPSANNFADKNTKLKNLIKVEGTKITKGIFSAPEIEEEKFYNVKIDVFSLGKVINYLIELKPKINPININYSNELKDIISQMTKDSEERPTSDEIYDIFIKYYGNKYIKYSSIYSIFTCFFNLNSIRNYFVQKYQKKDDNKITNYFVYYLFDYLKNSNELLLDENIIKFKLDIYGNDSKKEIDHISFMKFLLSNLNKELNEKKNSQYKREKYQSKNLKEEKFLNFKKPFTKLFDSVITKNFVGSLKLKRICKKCQLSNYYFSHFYFLSFNMKNLPKNNSKINFDETIKSLIKDIKVKRIYCKNCNEETEHKENVSIFEVPKNLIIMFDQIDFETKVNFPENLTLDRKYIEIMTSDNRKYNYYLCSILCCHKDDNENLVYISFTVNDLDYQNQNVRNYKYDYIINHYNIIGLFYSKDEKKGNRYYKINICKQVQNIIDKTDNKIINSNNINMENINQINKGMNNQNDTIPNNNDIINLQNSSINDIQFIILENRNNINYNYNIINNINGEIKYDEFNHIVPNDIIGGNHPRNQNLFNSPFDN